jgi:Kef-type K+ transport system membrane component KefB/nucleotide-binding universal stress UspA family protein
MTSGLANFAVHAAFSMIALPAPAGLLAAAGAPGESKVMVFFIQVALLITVGRLLGELLQRFGQPAVMGQIIGGVVLGPSVFGAIAPDWQQTLFPIAASGREMLKGLSELGILMLLLLTGLETDLALVKRVKRSAAFTSAGGIILPFICGYALGEWLPADLLPDPHRRLMTSLFLATALSISSVKIVAAVLREVDFLRRDLGQVILASSILGDTIGWTILSIIGGLAASGTVDLPKLALSVAGTGLFLAVSFTVGGGLVARLIRWSNDSFVVEMPVISVILVLMFALALLTNFIGVQTVLGAFVAGIMIGQSPILTRHIEEQLRGLIVALFMPVFFGVAGLSIDLKVLADPRLGLLTLVVIGIASVGKLGGCYLGSRLSGLTHAEGTAVGLGMNARGSTEIILATIGLGLGVLNKDLFTVIVLMAMVTTLAMPPLLRWSLERVELREEERRRLETETAEERERLPKIERVLVGLDARERENFAARLAGWLIGARGISATVLDWSGDPDGHATGPRRAPSELLFEATEEARRAGLVRQEARARRKPANGHPLDAAAQETADRQAPAVSDLVTVLQPKSPAEATGEKFASAILEEVAKGYGMIFIGTGSLAKAGEFQESIERIVHDFKGPVALLFGQRARAHDSEPLQKILVPAIGADYSRFGAEVAVAIAKGCGATITAVHVAVPPEGNLVRPAAHLLRTGRALVGDIEALGRREGVHVEPKALRGRVKESAILQQVEKGGHQLIVIGSKSQSAEQLHFGTSAMALIARAPCPVLIVKS